MNILIVEDEKIWADRITEILKDLSPSYYINTCSTGTETLEYLEDSDIVLLDINLGNESGLVLANKIREIHPDKLLIFVTTLGEYAREGYKVNAFRFVDKHFPEELKEAVRSAEKLIKSERKITLHIINGSDIQVKCRDIMYFNYYDHSVKVCTNEGILDCKGSILGFTKELQNDGFFPVDRAVLINISKICKLEPKKVTMVNGEIFRHSGKKHTELKEAFYSWKFR